MKSAEESNIIKILCLKIGNDICKSQRVPYGVDEVKAESEKLYKAIFPETAEETVLRVMKQVLSKKKADQPLHSDKV